MILERHPGRNKERVHPKQSRQLCVKLSCAQAQDPREKRPGTATLGLRRGFAGMSTDSSS